MNALRRCGPWMQFDARLPRPGAVHAAAAESLLPKQQIIAGNRSRRRAPNLPSLDRVVLGLLALLIRPHRIPKFSTILKTRTLFKLHKALVDRKYGLLFSSTDHRRKPGPKKPSPELIAAIVAMKLRNPKFGCVRIAQQNSRTFGVEIDKDVVRRVLAQHYQPDDARIRWPLLVDGDCSIQGQPLDASTSLDANRSCFTVTGC